MRFNKSRWELRSLSEFFKFINQVFRSLKWRSPSNRVIRLCPKCGSPDIYLSSKFDAWLMPEQYVCKRCGYKGPIILEIDKVDDSENASIYKTPSNSEE